jgi:hypothetical protein
MSPVVLSIGILLAAVAITQSARILDKN